MIVIDDDDAGDDASADAESRPSRTQLTLAARAVSELGVELTRLSASELDRLELPECVRQEVEVNKRLKPRARGRQNRLIGQLLRAEDHEAIRERFDQLKSAKRTGVQHEKRTEQWLVRLIAEGDPGVEALIDEYPEADRQQLRQLTRTARKDPESKKAKRARRELLRAIRAARV